MSILEIVEYPDPRLRKECAEVTEFDAPLQRLINDMVETMYAAEGIGLAAPQIGELIQLTVIDVSEERDSPVSIINPVITRKERKVRSAEGCLSIPGYRETITRAEEITVTYQDQNGTQHTLDADGLLGICLQHEIDHLHGVLFIDHLSRIKRELFKRWLNRHAPEAE